MKELYEAAIKIIQDISQIANTIHEVDSCFVNENILLRTEDCVGDSYRFANVRKTTYMQFLRTELKEHQKRLKVIEAEIKRSIN